MEILAIEILDNQCNHNIIWEVFIWESEINWFCI